MYAAANEEAVDSQQLDSAPPWKTEDTAQHSRMAGWRKNENNKQGRPLLLSLFIDDTQLQYTHTLYLTRLNNTKCWFTYEPTNMCAAYGPALPPSIR